MSVTLTRTTLGRLAAHEESPVSGVSTAFDPADWTAATNTSMASNAGRIRIVGSGSNRFNRAARYTAEAARDDMFVQALASNRTAGGSFGAYVRADADAIPDDWVLAKFPSGFSGDLGTYEYQAGAELQSEVTAAQNLTLPQRVSLYAVGSTAKAYFHGPAIEDDLTGLTLTNGHAALQYSSGSAQNMDYAAFFLMRNHLLRVNGPDSYEWYVRILDGDDVVLAETAPSVSTAVVDCFAERLIFPGAVTLEIRRGSDDALLIAVAPTERLWGGDVWEFADPPTVAFSVTTTVTPNASVHAAFAAAVTLGALSITAVTFTIATLVGIDARGLRERVASRLAKHWRLKGERTPPTNAANTAIRTIGGTPLETLSDVPLEPL